MKKERTNIYNAALDMIVRIMLYIAIVFFNLSGIAIVIWSYLTYHDAVMIGGIILILISLLMMDEDIARHQEEEECDD